MWENGDYMYMEKWITWYDYDYGHYEGFVFKNCQFKISLEEIRIAITTDIN